MIKILGQDLLINKIIKETNLDNFPRSLILEGKKGSGKHSIINIIAEHLNLQIIDATDKLSFEFITDCYTRSKPYIYIIDTSKISIKDQNTILKFLEEPLANAFIILLCTDIFQLLPTIINRCIRWTLNPYSPELLREICSGKDVDDLVFDLADTPGEVEALSTLDLKEVLAFIDKMFDKMNIAAFPNALTLANKIAFDNESDKIPFNVFVKLIQTTLENRSKQKQICDYAVGPTLTFINKASLPNVDEKYLFMHYITELWEASRQV